MSITYPNILDELIVHNGHRKCGVGAPFLTFSSRLRTNCLDGYLLYTFKAYSFPSTDTR